jgi:hypothetical protein
MAEYYKNEAVTFPSIVMKQIQIIQQITAKELRDGTRTIITPIGEQIYENEDSRYSFLQAVENFGSLLQPYFNEKTDTAFKNFLEVYDAELIEALKDEDFLEDLEDRFGIKKQGLKERANSDGKLKTELLTIFLNEKCKSARKMFRQLVQCFKDNDYLGSESFNEGTGIDDSLEADGDDETPMEEINEVGQ